RAMWSLRLIAAAWIRQPLAIDDVVIELPGLQTLEFGRMVSVRHRYQRQAAGWRALQFHLHLARCRRPDPELATCSLQGGAKHQGKSSVRASTQHGKVANNAPAGSSVPSAPASIWCTWPVNTST